MRDANKHKEVAAISAVMSYLRHEEESAALQQLHAANEISKSAASQAASNIWGKSGRQTQMQIRNLMQMKALYR